jgi:2-polyprenyl-3-methyl-5-hydroxy-6-metoxy-1,4-benzoquinol methylase
MRKDAIGLEERRLQDIDDLSGYQSLHERHRIFPLIFEDRNHKKVLDIAAGVGVVGKRIRELYPCDLICNDISPTCLKIMQKIGLKTTSFDIDRENPFPFPDKEFDAIISLATIEHVIHIDHFLNEIRRMLSDQGVLYLSAPNYSGIAYVLRFLLTGKTFHDPMSDSERYEFYAHVRYFTYRTLKEFVGSFGFVPETVYLAVPQSSSKYRAMRNNSKVMALFFRIAMESLYRLLSPRWASEPVICFRKTSGMKDNGLKVKVI